MSSYLDNWSLHMEWCGEAIHIVRIEVLWFQVDICIPQSLDYTLLHYHTHKLEIWKIARFTVNQKQVQVGPDYITYLYIHFLNNPNVLQHIGHILIQRRLVHIHILQLNYDMLCLLMPNHNHKTYSHGMIPSHKNLNQQKQHLRKTKVCTVTHTHIDDPNSSILIC